MIHSHQTILQYIIFGSLLLATIAMAAQPSDTKQGSNGYNTAYYVSPTGNDGNSGTKESPWKTIQHAADTVPPGSIIYVNAGTYPEHVTVTKSGTREKRVAFKSIPERSVSMHGFEISASYVRVEGFKIEPGNGSDVGVFVKSGDAVEVVDNHISECKIGIYVRSRGLLSSRLFISRNKMYRCNMGIWLVANDSLIENNEVERLVQAYKLDADYARFFGNNNIWRGNLFHGTSVSEIGNSHTDCFQFYDEHQIETHHTIIENNKCLGYFSQGMMLESDTYPDQTYLSDILVRNNIFAHGHNWAILAGKAVGWPNTVLVNNIFAYIDIMGVGIRGYKAKGGIVKNNIFYNCGNQPTPYFASHGAQMEGGYNLIFQSGKSPGFPDLVGQDPMFVDPEKNDFRLRAESPAIDAGECLPEVTTDIDGKSRPAGKSCDIGPYEYNP
jgi:hypothetical protein